MGIYSGSVSLSRYKLVGGKRPTLELVNRKLKSYQAKEIRLEGQTKEEKVGWVVPLTAELETDERHGTYWDMSDCQHGDGFMLRLRLERKKISSELHRILYDQKFRQLMISSGESPSRNKQKELKEEIKQELLAQCLPVISYVDAYWRTDGQVLLFSTAKKTMSLFEELFAATFAKPLSGHLIKIGPPLLGFANLPKDKDEQFIQILEEVEHLLPSPFRNGHSLGT